MQETDKNRILNFLIGNENIQDFETWLYSEINLESRIGSELYFELIDTSYKKKHILEDLKRNILGKYIPENDFENFKYKSVLHEAGWNQERKIKVRLSKDRNSPEDLNAIRIIEEYGGLKFYRNENNNEKHTLIEILEKPGRVENMKEYGLNKNLVLFASAHNSHIDLFVDGDNKFYQLDNVAAEDLYKYQGPDFESLMKELLHLVEFDKFHKIGKRKIESPKINGKKIWRIFKNNS